MITADQELLHLINRRAFLNRSVHGLGAMALSSLLRPVSAATLQPGTILHHPQRAKAVIHLCMAGGASHLETFDYKPKLAELDGQPMPESYTKGKPIAQLQGKALKVMGPQHGFSKYGKSGLEVSSILPHMASCADDLCVVKSMSTDQINHDPAHTVFNTGTSLPGRPSMGSWINYALGSECDDLPGFVVMTSVGGGQSQPIASRQWHSGFLPSKFQGVKFNSAGAPVNYIDNPPGVSRPRQTDIYGAIDALKIGEIIQCLKKGRRLFAPFCFSAFDHFLCQRHCTANITVVERFLGISIDICKRLRHRVCGRHHAPNCQQDAQEWHHIGPSAALNVSAP